MENTDERYTDIKQRTLNTQCLIIYEMSRMSAKTLNQVEFILWNTKNNGLSFGGIQMILCGDFYQLSPVANELYGYQGKHCFITNSLTRFFLTESICISYTDKLIRIWYLPLMNPLKEAFQMQQRQSYSHWVDLPNTVNVEDTVYLFCRNADADIHN